LYVVNARAELPWSQKEPVLHARNGKVAEIAPPPVALGDGVAIQPVAAGGRAAAALIVAVLGNAPTGAALPLLAVELAGESGSFCSALTASIGAASVWLEPRATDPALLPRSVLAVEVRVLADGQATGDAFPGEHALTAPACLA
jgi:hypothetical protein